MQYYQIFNFPNDFSDLSGKLVVHCVILSLLDAKFFHDFHLVKVVVHFPVNKIDFFEQLLLVKL